MKKRTRNALISLTALALGATVLLTGCAEETASSTTEATSTQQSTTTAATAPTQSAITKTATGATAEQTSELLASLTHQEMEELISGNTTLAEMEKKRFNLPETAPAASSESTAEAVSNSTTTAASTEQTAAPSSYDAELQDLINQLYAVKARAESGLNSAIQSAKSEYHALPSNEQTQSRKLSIVMSKSSELKNLQSSCDSEVNTIVNKMRKLLRENGQSTALADQALASYESQKSSTYNSLKSQLLG